MKPTAAERERADEFMRAGMFDGGDLANLMAAVRAEHDVASLMRDARWKTVWTIGYECKSQRFSVLNIADYVLDAASGDDSLGFIVASGWTPAEACLAALDIKEAT